MKFMDMKDYTQKDGGQLLLMSAEDITWGHRFRLEHKRLVNNVRLSCY